MYELALREAKQDCLRWLRGQIWAFGTNGRRLMDRILRARTFTQLRALIRFLYRPQDRRQFQRLIEVAERLVYVEADFRRIRNDPSRLFEIGRQIARSGRRPR